MSKSPLFSVVIPVYNKEKYIRRAIESVLNQSCQDFEVVIVCDPSTDNSLAEVGRISDPRIRIFCRDQPGPGGYAARNLGISMSAGTWVTFLDADDKWYPHNLLKLAELAGTCPDQSVLACSRLIEEKGTAGVDQFSGAFQNGPRTFSFADYLRYSFLLDKPFHPNAIAIRRDLLSDFQLFPEGRAERSGDLYAWVKLMARAGSFAWSSHVGSHIYKDVVGVTQLCQPNIEIFREMVQELHGSCSPQELFLLKRYANKLIVKAWYENRSRRMYGPMLRYLYWSSGVGFCIIGQPDPIFRML